METISKPKSPYAQRAWEEWLAARLGVSIPTASRLMAAAEADLADAGQVEATYADIAQLAADRGV